MFYDSEHDFFLLKKVKESSGTCINWVILHSQTKQNKIKESKSTFC